MGESEWGSSIDDVHHGDGQNLGVRSTQVFEKGKVELNGGGFCHGQGDAQDGVGPRRDLLGVPSRSIMILSMVGCRVASCLIFPGQ